MTTFPPFISVAPRRLRQGPSRRRYHPTPARALPLDFGGWELSEVRPVTFGDREEAGHTLALKLDFLRGADDVTVVGIPAGGMIVAAEISRFLQAPLNLWVAVKLRAPQPAHMAIGSLGEDGEMLVDEETVRRLHLSPTLLVDEVRARRAELARLTALFRQIVAAPEVRGRRVVIVDDGMASGSTMRAAILGLRHRGAASITVAVPVASSRLVRELNAEGVIVETIARPPSVTDLHEFYVHFEPVSDEDVMATIAASS